MRRPSTPAQLAALRTWIAGGGRLVIVGGTAGADSLTGFPDELLPYRPNGILDIDPAVLAAHPRRGTGGCRHPDGVCGRGRCRAGPGDLRRPRDRRGPHDRQRVRHAAGLRPHDVLAGCGRDLGHPAVAAPPAAANPGRHDARRRLEHRLGRDEPAQPGAAAHRRAHRPAVRLHPPRGPGELPRPAAAGPARVGVDHRARAHPRLHRRLVRHRRPAARLGRDHPRGRDRSRRTRDDRRHGPVLPRDLQPVPVDLPGPGPRRRAAVRADER